MSQADTRNLPGIFAVLMAAVLWGTTGTAATFATGVSPLAIGAVAMGTGGLLQAILAGRAVLRQHRQIAGNVRYLLPGALAVAIYPLAFYTSMHNAGVAAGTVVSIGSAPLFSALIEYIFDNHPLNRQWTLGALIGIAGMILLCLSESQQASIAYGPQIVFGILPGLVAGFTYAFYSWSARRMMQNGVSASAAMGSTFGAGALLLLPVLWVTGGPLLDSPVNTATGAYMALVPMFIGYLCYGYGLARIRASTATTLTLAEPVVAALLAVTLVGERLPLSGWTGIGLILLCLLIISLPQPHFSLFLRRMKPRPGPM